MRRNTRWLMWWGAMLCGIGLGLTTSGCSLLIKYGYNAVVSNEGYDWNDVEKPMTRTEVQERFGEPAASSTCPDGSRRDAFHLTAKTDRRFTVSGEPYTWWMNILDSVAVITTDFASAGLAELFLTPLAIQDVYKREHLPDDLQVAFVYGTDGEILYRYAVDNSPDVRFATAMRPLTESLWRRLAQSDCRSWTACLTAYVEESLRRAACVGSALTIEDERKVQRLLAIARDVDAGRIPRDEALGEIRKSCYPAACLSPAPSPPNPAGAERPTQGESSAGPA